VNRILIVEDEPALADSVRYGLEREGFECTVLSDGSRAVDYVRSWRPDLVLLDLMLPGMPGADVCREIRRVARVPIVMVTAKDSEADKVLGLELGADDYITKPFSMRELIARVRAVLRRRAETLPPESEAKIFRFAGFAADPQERRVTDAKGHEVELTGAEFDLLKTFLERPGRVLSRDQLLDLTRGREGDVLDRSIDVLVSRLRRKLGGGDASHLFKTVRNGGYQLAVKVDVEDAVS
jgi:two-component system, OmpR family, response regulator